MLTRKQLELLQFIHQRIEAEGVPPSFDEMKEALDLKSKSGIHRLITALEERGFIRRLAHRARAIEVLDIPKVSAKQGITQPSLTLVSNAPLRAQQRPSNERPITSDLELVAEVPLLGRIAAGSPIEALQQDDNRIGVPRMMLRAGGEHFALEVKGDSMIDLGINDGDIVIIRRQETANNGDIVVALVDNHVATLKRFRRKGSVIALEAANPNYETQLLGADRVKVQGLLVGLFRTY